MLERLDQLSAAASRMPATDYDDLNQHGAQQQFVDDLLAADTVQGDILDLGTGTAWIPVLLCQQVEACRIMAADLSVEMLEQARYTIEVHGVIDRVQLDHSDATNMAYQDEMFDFVVSHRLLHELGELSTALGEAVRVTNREGRLFFRDFERPDDEAALQRMVTQLTDAAAHQEWFRQALQAGWRVEEVQAAVEALGFDADTVRSDGTGCWTWSVRKSQRRG
jgi:ubiquinone/menaquinone biosynthesis C-methylase UbiE